MGSDYVQANGQRTGGTCRKRKKEKKKHTPFFAFPLHTNEGECFLCSNRHENVQEMFMNMNYHELPMNYIINYCC